MVVRMLTLLLICQLVGEVIARWANLPVPGPVIGMLILFMGLLVRYGRKVPDNESAGKDGEADSNELPKGIQDTANGLLSNLSLLFVPAGVGVMSHLGVMQTEALPILASLVVSTLVTMVVTAWVMVGLKKYTNPAEEEG